MKHLSTWILLLALPLLHSCKAEQERVAGDAQTAPAKASKPSFVSLETNRGKIVLELDSQNAPLTVANFLDYVKKGHYDGTVFHRVIDGFMIQGGGFAESGGKLVEKPTGKAIQNESNNGLRNLRGTIAMARTSDPHSATAQFFINVADNPGLDFPNHGGYAVFGRVVEGMEVVDAIKAVATGQGMLVMIDPRTGQSLEAPAADVPTATVTITKAMVIEQ